MSMIRRLRLSRTVPLVIVLVGVVIAGAVAIAGANDQAPVPQAHWIDRTGPIAQAIEVEQSSMLSILRRPIAVRDTMPVDAQQEIGNSEVSGRNVALARAIDTSTGRGWVLPGRGVICLAVPDPAGGFGLTCAETASVRTRGLALFMVAATDPDHADVTLLLPDRSSTDVTAANGGQQPLSPDADGVVAARLESGSQITVRSGAGVSQIAVPVAPRPTARVGAPAEAAAQVK